MTRREEGSGEQLGFEPGQPDASRDEIFSIYERRSPETLEEILRGLQRLNLPWYDEGLSEDPPRLKRFSLPNNRDTVVATYAFSKYLPGVFCVPFLYRMNFLSQLSTVAITTHLDGRHTRLSHAIGATKVAAALLEAIERNNSEGKDDSGAVFTMFERRACLLYCFIHDVFHGPFGHTLDMMKDVFHGVAKSKKLDDHYLQNALKSAVSEDPSPEGEQLLMAARLCTESSGAAHRLLELVLLLALDKERIAREEPRYIALKEIVDSDLDADRLDYIERDLHSLGKERNDRSIERLVDGANTLYDSDGALHLAFDAHERHDVEELLRDRQRLYADFYEAAPKLVVDDMLCHAIFYVLRDKRLLYAKGRPEERAEKLRQRILTNILVLTDSDLVAALRELGARKESYELLERVRQHQYFTPIYERAFRMDEISVVKEYGTQHLNSVGDKLDDLGYYDDDKETRWDQSDKDEVVRVSDNILRKYREEAERRYRQKQEDLVAAPASIDSSEAGIRAEDVLVWVFQYWLSGSFHNQFTLERDVTVRLLNRPAGSDWMEQYGTKKYGQADWYEKAGGKEHLLKYPPIHVTTTSYFEAFGEKEFRSVVKEGGGAVPKVWFYDRGAEGGTRRAIHPATRESDQAYPLIVSVDPFLEEIIGGNTIRGIFFEELRSLEWWRAGAEEGRITPPDDS